MYAELSEALFAVFLSFTGLVPFIHVNTIVELLSGVEFTNFGLFAAVLVFSRLSFELVANSKLGLASEETVYSLGKSKTSRKNIEIILFHCGAAVLVSILLFPFFSLFAKAAFNLLKPITPVLLIGVFVWFIALQRDKANALLVSLLAGAAGIITLEKNLPNALFILLTGLYAVPFLLRNEAPAAHAVTASNKLVILGSVIGMSSAFLPAMTPATLTVIALGFLDKQHKGFVPLNASILGSRTVSDFAAVEFLEKGRSGATAKMLETTSYPFQEIYAYIAIGAALSFVAALIALHVFRFLPSNLGIKTRAITFISIALYVAHTSGALGIASLCTCALIGLTCTELKVGKNTLGSSVLFASLKNYV